MDEDLPRRDGSIQIARQGGDGLQRVLSLDRENATRLAAAPLVAVENAARRTAER